jgi:hypothetical protein
MGDLSAIFKELPYEILNIILSFSEDGLIRTRYHQEFGWMIHYIQWESNFIFELEALLLVRRLFPMYWYYNAHSDEKHIYFFIKDYFKEEISRRGSWNF